MESLELGENIGEGEFGSVHKAIYMTDDGEVQNVAVKVGYQNHLETTLPQNILNDVVYSGF